MARACPPLRDWEIFLIFLPTADAMGSIIPPALRVMRRNSKINRFPIAIGKETVGSWLLAFGFYC